MSSVSQIEARIEFITPELAAQFLEHNINNRPKTQATVEVVVLITTKLIFAKPVNLQKL